MLNMFVRVAAFVVGMLLLAEACLTTTVESLKVDGHTTDWTRSSSPSDRGGDTDYIIHFASRDVSSCSVRRSTYDKVNDGDVVRVKVTRFFQNCVRITRGGELMEAFTIWRVVGVVGGLLLIAIGVGLIKAEYESD